MKAKKPITQYILGKVEIDTIIKRINGKALKQTERNYLSRSIRPKLMAAKLLTQKRILEKIQKPDKSLEKRIIYNLNKYGYELITLGRLKKYELFSVEELIAAIIAKLPDPRFIDAIPVILLKNKIDQFKLVEIAHDYDIKNQLGYLIETAIMIAKKFRIKNDLDELLNYFKKNLGKKIICLGNEKDETYNEFLKKTSPKRIKKWNLLGRFFDDDFIRNAGAYL